jgi:hypothetical protein
VIDGCAEDIAPAEQQLLVGKYDKFSKNHPHDVRNMLSHKVGTNM